MAKAEADLKAMVEEKKEAPSGARGTKLVVGRAE
jgi:hypothetical protein